MIAIVAVVVLALVSVPRGTDDVVTSATRYSSITEIVADDPDPIELEPEPEPEPIVVPEGLSDVQIEAWLTLRELGREHEWDCLDEIVVAESSWRPNVVGDLDRGGSYGLVQRHAPSHGKPDLPWAVDDQIRWAVEYADERYGGLCEAAEARRGKGWW